MNRTSELRGPSNALIEVAPGIVEGAPEDASVRQLREGLEALRARVDEGAEQDGANYRKLRDAIGRANRRIDGLLEGLAGIDGDLAAIGARVASLQSRIAAVGEIAEKVARYQRRGE